MTATYSFDVDPARGLVTVTMAGFFTLDDVARFATDRAAAHRQLRTAPNRHLTLVDMRGMKIQSGEVVAAFESVLGETSFHSRRLAFVVEPSLARSQIRRAAERRRPRYFAEIAEALAWLSEAETDGMASAA